MKIKVCGLKNNQNIAEVSALNIDMMGFIFHTESKRNIELTPQLNQTIYNISKLKVGVFVNETIYRINNLIKTLGLNYVQLHGDESEAYIKKINPNVEIIKVFKIDASFDFSICDNFSSAHLFLFDTRGKFHGGNGEKFNWDLLSEYNGNIPFLLSGGITLKDTAEIKRLDHPKLIGLDINSGFEHEPGLKNLNLIKSFTQKLKPDKFSISESGYYGNYGGAYIPEILFDSVNKLKNMFYAIKEDPQFKAEYLELLKHYVGRPSPLYFSNYLSKKHQANIYLKREDLNHTGAHKINNTIGQILLAKKWVRQELLQKQVLANMAWLQLQYVH